MEAAIILGVITLIVFIIGREFFCWYTKINRIVELLEQINKE